MDKKNYEYDATTLKKLFFDSDLYENEMEFSYKLTHSVQNPENDENYKSRIKVEGELEARNSKDEVVTRILMESYFKSETFLSDEEFNQIEEAEYFNQPIMSELTLLLGSLTGKAFRVPLIISMPPPNLSETNK